MRHIPTAWTSLIAEDPAVIFGNGQAPFRLHDLLELVRLIDVLRDRSHLEAVPEGTSAASAGVGRHV